MASLVDHTENDAGIFQSPTFEKDIKIHINEPIGSATIAPSGRDVALASKHGLHIIDLDSPYAPPRRLQHNSPWTPADAQWSPFASRYYWIITTSNQRALVWNLEIASPKAPIEFVLHAHTRAITDINFSAFHPEILATCAVDAFIHTWDLRVPERPAISLSDWFAGASQVKWSRKDPHVIASSHDKYLRIWDDRKGAVPLISIDAHTTKIYGVDWNRLDSTKIITCALDRTIKLWDYAISDKHPERVIRTPYPVWRARHTPFGEGILAMPQRGDDRLHLFDNKREANTPYDAPVDPVYSFKGHEDSVKEFLWRARGTIADGHDNRDFQLVTWGNDQDLILHKMKDKYFRQVGHEKGMHVDRTFPLTRRGSPYKSFQNAQNALGNEHEFEGHTLWQDRIEEKIPVLHKRTGTSTADDDHTFMTRAVSKSAIGGSLPNVISWMRGVKFGKASKHTDRRVPGHFQRSSSSGLQKETLTDELIYISDTFKNIAFENVDVKEGHAKVSLSGPWGSNDDLVFLVAEIAFPKAYPVDVAPKFVLSSSSGLNPARQEQLSDDLQQIADLHVQRGVGCLEAVLLYLTGEHSLKQATSWLEHDDLDPHVAMEAESSSDEDDTLGDLATAESQILKGGDMHQPSLLGKNAGVPIPKACGAIWGQDGSLVCFFPPKSQPVSLFGKLAAAQTREKTDIMHEGLGRILIENEQEHGSQDHSLDASNDNSDIDNEYSTDSSSGLEDEVAFPDFKSSLFSKREWRHVSLGRHKGTTSITGSQRNSTNAAARMASDAKFKTIVTIRTVDDILPARRTLGLKYEVLGDPSDVCRHNSQAASDVGLALESDIWSMLALIMTRDVPLALTALGRQSTVLVIAAKILANEHRTQLSSDTTCKDTRESAQPDLTGLVRWANHPFGASGVIKTILEYFEARAHVQMLGAISCLLAVPNQGTGVLGVADPLNELSTLSMAWPGCQLPYYPSRACAQAALQADISSVESSRLPQRHFDAYGSSASSDDLLQALAAGDLPSSLSTGSTPPIVLSKANTTRSGLVQSLSVSPELRLSRGENSAFSSSLWSRPLNFITTPTNRNKTNSGEDNLPSSYTSPSVRRHASQSQVRPSSGLRRVSSAYAIDSEASSSDEEHEGPATPAPQVKVRLLDQSRFEDEGQAEMSLIPIEYAARLPLYRRYYASMLEAWNLPLKAAEVRRFDGNHFVHNDTSTAQVLDDAVSQVTTVVGGGGTKQGDPRDAYGSVLSDETDHRPLLRHCGRCGHADDVATLRKSKCTRCGFKQRSLRCGLCAEPVAGLFRTCEACGHVAHLACVANLVQDRHVERHDGGEAGEESDAVSFDGNLVMCEMGCGCVCGGSAAAVDEP